MRSVDKTSAYKTNNERALVVEMSSNGSKSYMSFELPHKKRKLKFEWTERDMNTYAKGQRNGLALRVIIDDSQVRKMHLKSYYLYENGHPWSPDNMEDFSDAFLKISQRINFQKMLPQGPPSVAMMGFYDWVSCVANFSSAGAGIGAGIGGLVGSGGGPAGTVAGAATGGAIGLGLGGSFGVGYCTGRAIVEGIEGGERPRGRQNQSRHQMRFML